MKEREFIIDGSSGFEMYVEFGSTNMDLSCSEEEMLNQKYWINIYSIEEKNDELGKKECVARIELTYIDVGMALELGWTIFDLFDLINSEKQGVYEYLFENDDEPNSEYVGMDLDVIYVDEIFVEEKYRNRGIGSLIVSNIPNIIRYGLKLKAGCLVLLANPFEEKDDKRIIITDKRKINKLIRFYESNGFERIEDTQYLVKNMDYNNAKKN